MENISGWLSANAIDWGIKVIIAGFISKLLQKALQSSGTDPTLIKFPGSINLSVRPWVNAENYWSVRPDLLEGTKVKLDEVSISIPYPQQDVHLHKVGVA
ncbi:MAG: hypothetical protein GY820_32925 [Gammaproteobacteria bacterium]|nr:hypothetical protein [Gammaproteobacteria bacterium]